MPSELLRRLNRFLDQNKARQIMALEAVPRLSGGIRRLCRIRQDGSTWLWTAFRNQVGRGEASSGLIFDQVLGQADDRSQ